MFVRGSLLIVVLIAAFVAPYFVTRQPQDQPSPLAAWWDSMWTDSIDDAHGGPYGSAVRAPLPSASPVPGSYGRFDGSGTFAPRQANGLRAQTNPYAAVPGMAGLTDTAGPAPPKYVPGQAVAEPGGWVTVGPAPGYANSTVGPGVLAGQVISSPTVISGPTVVGVQPGVPIYAVPGSQIPTGRPASVPSVPTPAQNFAELLRFDVQPDWVVGGWDRVSTQIMNDDLAGMRVPLVSGTNAQDLAGSLSYYFDPHQQLQRIGFLGTTGDPTELATYLAREYGLRAEPALGGGLFVSRDSANPQLIRSAVRLRQSPVVRQSEPLKRYQVQMELNRPGGSWGLSPEFQMLLNNEIKSGRWIPQPPEAVSTDPGGPPAATASPVPATQPPGTTAPQAQQPESQSPRSYPSPIPRRPPFMPSGPVGIPQSDSPPLTKG